MAVSNEASPRTIVGGNEARAFIRRRTSILLGSLMLVVLVVLGLVTVSGFATGANVRSMLVFASFLGVAAIGQTLCSLVGGLDLSIPYIIGGADIGLLWLLSKGYTSLEGILLIVGISVLIGAINGLVSYRRPSQSLIVTLGMGFTVLGLAQYVTSSSTQAGGTLAGQAPGWLQRFVTVGGHTFGVGVAPTVILWVVLGAIVIVAMRITWIGRGIYAVGGNNVAARLARIPQALIWALVFAVSGATAAVAGILLLGYGGGYADIGQPYLFSTVAAVIIGGTSLNGGRGGYGLTVLGVAVLTVLTTVLIGVGLSDAAQQTVLGLIIVPMVAVYARAPHPSTQI